MSSQPTQTTQTTIVPKSATTLIPAVHDDLMTLDLFRQALPPGATVSPTQVMVDEINSVLVDPSLREAYRDNLLSYTNVLMEGRFSLGKYISGVRYCSFVLTGSSHISAYSKTFPAKYSRWNLEGVTESSIHKYVSAYHKTVMVQKILEQSMIPVHILNMDLFQKAINVQADIMTDSDASPKVRSDAANSLLTHLKPPETQKVELDVAPSLSGSIANLREASLALAAKQRDLIEGRVATTQDVAHSVVVPKTEE